MDYTEEEWAFLIAEMHSGKTVVVDEEFYHYFLEVLPPVGMPWKAKFADGTERTCSFGFAEGWEPVVAFWKEGGKYFCRQTTQMNPHT